MNGTYIAEALHTVNALPPVNINGGVTAQAFSMAEAGHVSIVIAFGASAAVPTAILLNQCSSAGGAGATAMGFKYHFQPTGGAGNDVMGAVLYATSSGVTSFPSSVADLVYIIEVDAAELEVQAAVVGTITELPYLQVQITDGGNNTYVSIVAYLSAMRHAGKSSASVTV